MTDPAIKLYIGGSAGQVQGRPMLLTGPRMFNGADNRKDRRGPAEFFTAEHTPLLEGWIDSGAFQDVGPGRRIDPAAALDRQLWWEGKAREKWHSPNWMLQRLVSYDLLIDEKWVGGKKKKVRWDVTEADAAVRATVDGAAFLASKRDLLAPRGLVLACQGVDAAQYADCAAGVLAHCTPADVFGLGGWCILGMQRSYLPTFWASIRRVLPMVAARGVTRVHIFGVLWRKPLGGLLWLADQHGLKVSTDSSSPVLAACWKNVRPSNKKRDRWEDNCEWHRNDLANIRNSEWYREPPTTEARRQMTIW